MSEQEQCEGCLQYKENSELKKFCEDCEDKAAKYDITARDLKKLLHAAKHAYFILANIPNDCTDNLERAKAMGTAKGALASGLIACAHGSIKNEIEILVGI